MNNNIYSVRPLWMNADNAFKCKVKVPWFDKARPIEDQPQTKNLKQERISQWTNPHVMQT